MAQGVLPFEYESEPGSSDLTGFAGIGVYLDLIEASGLAAAVRRQVRPAGARGGLANLSGPQLRDCQYAIDAGDAIFAPAMKMLILRAGVPGRRRKRLKDITLQKYRGDLERRMDKVMACQPTNKDGIRLRKRSGKDRDSLFTFMTERDVPPTNNGSEQAIRPSTTLRKVTGGFRSNWGADF